MLEIIEHGPVREIRLARPPANALNEELVIALQEALAAAGRESNAVVVSGQPGMFSAGLDVPLLIELDQPAMTRFWRAFQVLMKTIACMPVPVAFALNGHSPAGGIVMAVFADFRVAAAGNFKTGFNEVQVGLVVPPAVHQVLCRTIGHQQAERILVSGEMMDSAKAHAIGLVDELADTPEACVERALAWAKQHAALPVNAMRTTRNMARADIRAIFDNDDKLDPSAFVGIWFNDETQATLRAMVESLKNRE
jgi:enoyl-CoA hydratase/carnithine racemase